MKAVPASCTQQHTVALTQHPWHCQLTKQATDISDRSRILAQFNQQLRGVQVSSLASCNQWRDARGGRQQRHTLAMQPAHKLCRPSRTGNEHAVLTILGNMSPRKQGTRTIKQHVDEGRVCPFSTARTASTTCRMSHCGQRRRSHCTSSRLRERHAWRKIEPMACTQARTKMSAA